MSCNYFIYNLVTVQLHIINVNNALQNFLMRGSTIYLPSLLEECEDTALLCKLAAKTYDQGQTYTNTKVKLSLFYLCNFIY